MSIYYINIRWESYGLWIYYIIIYSIEQQVNTHYNEGDTSFVSLIKINVNCKRKEAVFSDRWANVWDIGRALNSYLFRLKYFDSHISF